MKILATEAAEGQVIVSMTKDEVAQLTGFYSAYNMKDQGEGFKPGARFQIGALYERASQVITMHKEAQDGAEKLRKASVLFLSCFDDKK
jgi:hypothetical protein